MGGAHRSATPPSPQREAWPAGGAFHQGGGGEGREKVFDSLARDTVSKVIAAVAVTVAVAGSPANVSSVLTLKSECH